MLAIERLTVEYSGRRVLDSLSLEVAAGSRAGVAGESGSGKTTLLKAVAGLLDSRDARVSGRCDSAGRIGYIPQEATHSLSPYLRVIDQVAELAKSRKQASAMLQSAGLDRRRQESYPHQLSGGERQRVLIQQALAMNPSVILADEPTANLDEATEAAMLDQIDDYLQRSRATLLVASHQESVFGRLGCRVHRLTPAPESTWSKAPPPASPDSADLLQIDQVTKSYFPRDFFLRRRPGIRALAGVSLKIRAGETIALVGPSGCGKSTLSRCLARRTRWDSGGIQYRGTDLRSLPALHGCVQLVQQEPSESLNPRMTVRQALDEASTKRDPALLDRLMLPGAWAGRKVSELSEGQRARIAIARCITALDGGLLILDESLSGLDPVTTRAVAGYIQDVQRETGMACLLTTHRFELAQAVAHRIVRMQEGRVDG